MFDFREIFGLQGPLQGALPGFRARSQQAHMAERVALALESHSPLIVEAGTGTGKTFAYLVPALLSGARVLISTGTRALQDQLFAKDLPLVAGALGRPARVAVLKGRANYLCHHRLSQAQAQRVQTAAQLTSFQRRITQAEATQTRISDVLAKFDVVSPIDGVVTNLPVRTGETVVPGIQSSAGSTMMTIADMSLITAEVKVDETDIVNVKLDQTGDITIDAIPNKTFKGHVIEIGNTAILRSTGVAASQSAVSSQEAKDFKVVVAMDNPPDEIRPGLSCTAKITTATRKNVLSIPIQALTVRQKGQLEPKPANGKVVQAATTKLDPVAEKAKKEELQGVFVVSGGKAVFKKVETGITGSTDIEVLTGLAEGNQIVTGTYQVIRTILNETQVKVDNKTPAEAAKS